jgi:type II secretory pathway pseudopilin PulG
MLYHKDNRGLTLLEVLVAIGIATLVIGSIVTIFLVSFRSKDIVFDQLLSQGQARQVVQEFVGELRSARASSIGAYPLETAGTSTIVFYANVDSDTLVERVRYFISSTGTFKRGVIKPTGTPMTYPTSNESISSMVNYVSSTTGLFYYDQNYTGSATSTSLSQPVSVTTVRLVEIRLVLDRDPTKSPVPIIIQSNPVV